ncbi:MAG: hypothetical protein RSB67_02785 [Clostridia bacterium]
MKKGVTLIIAVVAISVMSVLISAAAVVGSSSITSANFDEYVSQLNRVSDDVNQYYIENGKLPVTGEIVALESLGNYFINTVVEKGDDTEKLLVVDMARISDSTIKRGRSTIMSMDVFVVTENTHNIYYLKGFKYKSQLYFCN